MNRTPQKFITPDTVKECLGQTFTSNWVLIDQPMITAFSRLTRDPDPHHIDPEYCRENSPWGKTIAFGFLTVSLLTSMLYDVYRYPLHGTAEDGVPLNYGFRKLRLVEAVPVDSRIRAHFTVQDVRLRKPGQELTLLDVEVEIEGFERPALTATWESLWVRPV